MRDDYADLKEALKFKARQTLTSKEILTAIVAGVTIILTGIFAPEIPIKGAVPIVSGLVTVGGIIAADSKWRRAGALLTSIRLPTFMDFRAAPNGRRRIRRG